MSAYVSTSGPPMSKPRERSAGIPAGPAQATRYRSTSPIAIGWTRVRTQRGVTITGNRSVRYRSISNDADPEPMTTPARSTTAGIPLARKMSPTSVRERRWADAPASGPPDAGPPR
jgi:hypothetical protein